MALNSVNTNVAASIALTSLELTNSQLAAVQKQISTGYRVADATDDGAAYAIAQRVRSDVSALASANQQLGNVQGLLSTTVSSLNDISNTLSSARDVLVKLAASNTQGTERSQYIAQYQSLHGADQVVLPGRGLQRQDADRRHVRQRGHVRRGRRGPQRGRRQLQHRHVQRLGLLRLDQLHLDAAHGGDHGGDADLGDSDFRCLHQPAQHARHRAEHLRLGHQLRDQPDHLQHRQDHRAERRAGLAGRCRPGAGIGAAAVAADPPAARHPGAVDRQPGAAELCSACSSDVRWRWQKASVSRWVRGRRDRRKQRGRASPCPRSFSNCARATR